MDESTLEFEPAHISIIDEDLEDRLRILSRSASVSFHFKGSRLTIVAKEYEINYLCYILKLIIKIYFLFIATLRRIF